jgi:hypothetical protein
MFLDQELKTIRESKNSLAICCDLRRRLVHIEVRGIWAGVRNSVSALTLGLAVVEEILGFLRERKGNRR